MSKVAEQLTEARQNLLDHNWFPEYLSTSNSHAYCALTAFLVNGSLAQRARGLDALIDEVPEPYVGRYRGAGSLMSFNDAPCRIKAEVVALYDRALGRAMWIRE